MKQFLFIMLALVATLPLKAQFDPLLVNMDVAKAPYFIDKIEPMTHIGISLAPEPVPPFSCYEDSTCTNWGPWKTDSAIVIHPLFPDCPIYIGYKHRNCATNQKLQQHYMTCLNYLENDPDCSSLHLWLTNGVIGPGGTIDPDKMNKLEHDVYALLAKQIFIQFNDMEMKYMGDTLYCDTYDNYKVSYAKGTCTGRCVGYYTCGTPGARAIVIYPKACDADACCKVTNAFCIDRATGVLIHQEDIEMGNQSPNCTAAPMTDNECYDMHNDTEQSSLEEVRVLNCKPACDINFVNFGGDQIVK